MSDEFIPVTCVACGEPHIESRVEAAEATRVGISFVHRDCTWTMRYPGQSAAQVIEALEARLVAGAGPSGPVGVAQAAAEAGEVVPVALLKPDGESSVEGLILPASEGRVGERMCSVCHGDGELVSGDDVTICPRCNGVGRISVAA
jgi:hypothetical protein